MTTCLLYINGMLLRHIQEGNLAICDNMDLEDIILSEATQTEKDKYCMEPLICRT